MAADEQDEQDSGFENEQGRRYCSGRRLSAIRSELFQCDETKLRNRWPVPDFKIEAGQEVIL